MKSLFKLLNNSDTRSQVILQPFRDQRNNLFIMIIMAYIPSMLPGADTRNNPMMSPQNLSESEDGRRESAKITKTRQVRANTNPQNKTRQTGRARVHMRPGKSPGRSNSKSSNFGHSDGKGKLVITQSDFGFDISGSSTPATFSGIPDHTLYRDYNEKGKVPLLSIDSYVNTVTNATKALEINFSHSLDSSTAYTETYSTCYKMLIRDIILNTKSAAGAINAISEQGMITYLDVVSQAFDLLIQLEVLQAWGPSTNDYYDSSLRELASLSSTAQILTARTALRQALIPHVLPQKWMDYIKWLRETKLKNETAESVKQRFSSLDILTLCFNLTNDQGPDAFVIKVAALVAELNLLNPVIPANLLINSDAIKFRNVKDHFNTVHNSAVYDPDFNDIWTNRVILTKFSGIADVFKFPSSQDGSGIAAFRTVSPDSIALATIGHQLNPIESGVPLEGYLSYFHAGTSPSIQTNRIYYFINSTTNKVTQKIVENWFDCVDDSMHIADYSQQNMLGISTPKGRQTSAYVLGESNIKMACREALMDLFLN